MADIYINSEELKLVASEMKNKSNSILDTYKSDVMNAIMMGSESIQISGLDASNVLSSFDRIFTSLNTRINNLSDFLNNAVANEYDLVSSSIANEFNNSFATELAKLLGITIPTSVPKITEIIETNNDGIYVRSNVDVATGRSTKTNNNDSVLNNKDYNSNPSDRNPSLGSNPLKANDNIKPEKVTKAVAVTQDESEYVTPRAEYYQKNGGYRSELNNASTRASKNTETTKVSNLQGRNYDTDPIRVPPMPSREKTYNFSKRGIGESVLDSRIIQ